MNHVISTLAEFNALIAGAGAAAAGDIVYLRGGTYTASVAGLSTGSNNAGKGVFQIKCPGNSANWITFKPYPHESVRINGGIEIWDAHNPGGSYTIWQGLEIAPTPTTRSFATKTAVDYPCCFGGDASHVKLINCYLHDGQDVYPMPIYNGDWEVHGCVISNPGFYTTDDPRNRDYCIYAHNAGTTTRNTITISNNAFITPFGSWGVCLYSDSGVSVQDFLVEDNAFFEAALLIASNGGTTRNNIFQRNYGYNRSNYLTATGGKNLRLGNADGDTALDNILLNNYWVTRDSLALQFDYQRQCNCQYNTIVHMSDTANTQMVVLWYPTTQGDLGVVINNNVYHNAGNLNRFAFDANASAYRTFATWQSVNGWDTSSTHTAAVPTANVVKVIDNDYEEGRGFVVIYNWEGLTAVDADLSTLRITDGDNCRCRNCANMDEYFDFTYDAGDPTLSIPMTTATWTLKSPTAYDSPITWPYTNPVPNYGIFLIEKVKETKREGAVLNWFFGR